MEPARKTMKLLNCRSCDDVVKLIEHKERSCECGKSQGALEPEHAIGAAIYAERVVTRGPARVLEIPWEEYDGIAEGEMRMFGVLPRSRY